jgi:hypothetical protein
MTYEEKRELRLQISQLLADAGLNQKAIKDMVETEIKNKVDRAIEQTINSLNSECSSGNYFRKRIDSYLGSYAVKMDMDKAVRDELKNKVIQVVLKDCEATNEY